eukprot:CAMPEP_0203697640 /NCGR_PEP_ID=MMETSP0091-20130426/11713_1 /ASSEMBLY_ACC=CAM_ASM_001089 /TAXON_ID=426623 /ORGANISM="Chaetoceros affinis, Strain CCMP159" /LENGTH=62 /DNA_ID=CAMNT_0050569687 /DNA_START=282 /DNA_END=466 /DNA_ORIENTATION=-
MPVVAPTAAFMIPDSSVFSNPSGNCQLLGGVCFDAFWSDIVKVDQSTWLVVVVGGNSAYPAA